MECTTVRSAADIKRKLLREAWTGQTGRTPAETRQLILQYHRRALSMPEADRATLDEMQAVSRDILALEPEVERRMRTGEGRDPVVEARLDEARAKHEEQRQALHAQGVPNSLLQSFNEGLARLQIMEEARNSSRVWKDEFAGETLAQVQARIAPIGNRLN